MHELPTAKDRILVTGDFSGFEPEELFEHWVKPELITQWWPTAAEIDPRLGGQYVLSWPSQGWVLRGEYFEFLPGERLGFTWAWDHEPKLPTPRKVLVGFGKAVQGSHLLIEHWPFGPQEGEERQGIVEGWIHFGMRLAGLRVSSA